MQVWTCGRCHEPPESLRRRGGCRGSLCARTPTLAYDAPQVTTKDPPRLTGAEGLPCFALLLSSFEVIFSSQRPSGNCLLLSSLMRLCQMKKESLEHIPE